MQAGSVLQTAAPSVPGDLKPGNVWLTERGAARIGDFGLAVATDRSRLTREGMMVGTVAYMPPEQAMGPTDRWIDPWSCDEVQHQRRGEDGRCRNVLPFANYLAYDDHLIAVTASANRSKADRGPEEWQPPLESYWCDYAIDWITIKATWELTATPAEWTALEDMLGRCELTVVFEPASATSTPTASPTATPTGTAVASVSVLITEMMINPAAVADTAGEWFELFNPGPDAVDINGWTIRDQGADAHVIANGGPLLVPAQGYLVLGRNSDAATNGGVVVAYRYSGFSLVNTEDEIEVVDADGTVVDAVTYTSVIVFDGRSASLDSAALSATANDALANWCAATALMAGGDRGTPGVANDACP